MFIRRLDILEQANVDKANRAGRAVENPIYTDETTLMCWSVFTNESPETMLGRERSSERCPSSR